MTSTDMLANLEKIEKSRDQNSLQRTLTSELQDLGISRYLYIFVPPDILFDRGHLIYFQHGYDLIPGFCQDYENYLKSEEAISYFSFFRRGETRAHYGIESKPDSYLKNLYAILHKYKKDLAFDKALNVPVFGPQSHYGIFHMRAETPDLNRAALRKVELICQAAHLRNIEFYLKSSEPIKLSRREKEVLLALVKGKTNSQIAEKLRISKHTVDAYLRRIYVKLDVNDRVTASIKAMNFNLLNDAPMETDWRETGAA